MVIPLYSTFALATELILTGIVIHIFYSGYAKNIFPYRLAIGAVAYEVLFNISYMVYRVTTHVPSTAESGFEIGLAIFHGTLSLIMFVALIAYFALAFKNYKSGINCFKEHKVLTIVFIVFWLLSVLSGALFYAVEYLL